MLARILAACGYSKPEDLVDFLMTGVAVAPIVVFLGSGIGEAIMVMIGCLLPAFVAFPWLYGREDIRRRKEADRIDSIRRLTGRDPK